LELKKEDPAITIAEMMGTVKWGEKKSRSWLAIKKSFSDPLNKELFDTIDQGVICIFKPVSN
jgi:hypothetical protein